MAAYHRNITITMHEGEAALLYDALVEDEFAPSFIKELTAELGDFSGVVEDAE